jgi:chemotaxis protein MotA
MAETKKSSKIVKPDLASIGGLALALAGILGGLIMEKGSVRDVSQITAALIVLGGTFGATLVGTPLAVVLRALQRLKSVFMNESLPTEGLIEEIIGYATRARKNGLVSLERDAMEVEDPFLRKALNLAVDGTDLQELRKMLELEISLEEQAAEAEAAVFESAGGYSPTIGIIGAVLGLIQVMKNLANIDEVGRGIAVAFVATVYGVAFANLFLLPAANKIKAVIHREIERKELILEGVVGIVEGLNPKLIRSKIEAYAPAARSAPGKSKESAKAQPAGQPMRAEG